MKYFNFKLLMFFAALVLATPPAGAQGAVTVCDGTATTEYLPVYGYNFDYTQHNQMIYPASELQDLPAGSFITAITFYPTAGLQFSGTAVNFSMANLNEATPYQLDGYGNAEPLSVTVTPAASVNPNGDNPWTITLEDAFEYTGGDLLIEVTSAGGTYGSNSFTAKDVDYYGYYSYGSYTKKGEAKLPKLTIAYESEAKPYVAKVNPTSLDFGKLMPNAESTLNITVKNSGANAFTPILSGLEGTSFSASYSSAIEPGTQVTIPVTYNPTEVGNHSATLSITAAETSEISLSVALTGRCANDITVEEGTTTNSSLPLFYPGYYTQKNQMIYPASDLTSLVGKKITGLTFYSPDVLTFDCTYNLAVGMTTQATYSDATPIEGLTEVATNHTAVTGANEFTIVFDQPFTYTGDNLVVQIQVTDMGTSGYKAFNFYGTNQSGNTAYYWYNASYGNYGYARAFLPMMTIDYSGDPVVIEDVEAPTFDPEDGTTFEENLTVTLSCATAGATIQYSYNGEYFTDYDAPIEIDETTTIYAKAVLGTNESDVVSATYTKEAAPQPSTDCPAVIAFKNEDADGTTAFGNDLNAFLATVSDGAGYIDQVTSQYVYQGATGLKFSSSKNNGSLTIGLKEQTDGSTWKTSKIVVSAKKWSNDAAKISVNQADAVDLTDEFADYEFTVDGTILDAVSIAVTKRAYVKSITIYHECGSEPVKVNTPTFDPEEGEYTEAQNVTIACSTPGATIHYTTDGTDPTAESAVYSEPIAVSETMTIKAIAMKADMADSEIATATYTINTTPAGDEKIYVKLTSAELTPGKKYIFVYEGDQPVAMGAYNAQKCDPVNVTINNGEVNIANLGVTEFIAGEGPAVYGADIKQYTLAFPDGKYLAYASSTNFKQMDAVGQNDTEGFWRIKENESANGGYTVFNASATGRSIQKHSTTHKFGPYSSGQEPVAIYVEKPNGEPVVEPVDPEMSFGETTEFTVYPEADFTAPTLNTVPEDLPVTYSSSDEDIAAVNETTGEVLIVEKTGTATITASFAGNEQYNAATATYTITVEPKPYLMAEPTALEMEAIVGQTDTKTFTVMGENLKGNVTLTLNDENEVFSIEPATITQEAAADGVEVTVTYAPTAEDVHEATIDITSQDADKVTITLTAMATAPVPVVVAAPTFTPEAGSYTEALTVAIACETEGAVISYSTDGGQTWTQGTTVTVDEDMTLMVKAEKENTVTTATAIYSFEFPVEPITMEPIDGYFQIKNLGNDKYANVEGRTTLRFTDAADDKAGTVIRVKTNENGQVQVLRSQAADLQRYADRAMSYVPELVHLVADKLEMEGVGALFGENGVDMILDKFNEGFDAHLYVEPADGGYRIYGKTPSMQHVVDFYRENQAKCDAKLPMLEDAINRAIEKILEKTNGSGASILVPFSLHTIWEKMDNSYLIEPVDDETTLSFYHQVLMNKDFVWDFAYETAMIYWTNLKNHPRYENEIKPQLGEFAEYIDKIENVRPNYKYYIVQKNDKPDFISEGNADIKNGAARTIWSVEPRTEFVVNVPEANKYFNKYVTTLYTDFAYNLPEGVIAYKVIDVNDEAYAQIKAIDGTIPAQMPVLLISKTAGDLTLTINNNDGKAHADNQLKGPDYLISTYQIKSPAVEKLFNLVKTLFGEEIYNRYMLDYEHLMLRNSGMVRNKYFWGLSEEEVATCGTTNEYDQVDCVVRSLEPTEGDHAAFYNNGIVNSNQAFLVSDTYDPIKIMIKGDINRDGKANIEDVTALIDILLYLPEENFSEQYDYEAADFDEDETINVQDLADLIDYLLFNGIEGDNGIDPEDDIIDNH